MASLDHQPLNVCIGNLGCRFQLLCWVNHHIINFIVLNDITRQGWPRLDNNHIQSIQAPVLSVPKGRTGTNSAKCRHTHTHIHIRTHIHICTHIHTHTHTHTYHTSQYITVTSSLNQLVLVQLYTVHCTKDHSCKAPLKMQCREHSHSTPVSGMSVVTLAMASIQA